LRTRLTTAKAADHGSETSADHYGTGPRRSSLSATITVASSTRPCTRDSTSATSSVSRRSPKAAASVASLDAAGDTPRAVRVVDDTTASHEQVTRYGPLAIPWSNLGRSSHPHDELLEELGIHVPLEIAGCRALRSRATRAATIGGDPK
jgi:hypothetical protein